jgi:peptidoglycan/LPS O-acetylase OafA/YrhL
MNRQQGALNQVNTYFVSHISHDRALYKIPLDDAIPAVAIISIMILVLAFISAGRTTARNERDGDFLRFETSEMLRGLAVLFLIFGHFMFFCVDAKSSYAKTSNLAVVIFLFISGVALSKQYGIDPVDGSFIKKRIKKLAIPTWIILALFFTLDFFLLEKIYPLHRVAASFGGIMTHHLPNGAIWFITYILYLYLLFFIVSRTPLSRSMKPALMLLLSCTTTFLIWQFDILFDNFYLWTQYTIVFPLSVYIGLKSAGVKKGLDGLINSSAIGYYVLMFSLFCMTILGMVFNPEPYSANASLTLKVISTIQPITMIISLVMLSNIFDRLTVSSKLLTFLGAYSFEIYLCHQPFIANYDFFLFRRPLFFYFLIYFLFVIAVSYSLKNAAVYLNGKAFRN